MTPVVVNASGLPTGTVTLVSDQALADEVQGRAISTHISQLLETAHKAERDPKAPVPWGSKRLDPILSRYVRPKDVQPVPQIDSSTVKWQVSAGDLLLRLGQALAPGAGGQSPYLSSVHWPIVKYVDFFHEVNGQLCAGPQASKYVLHGRTAISDELGVAFSLLAAEHWLRETYSLDVIDIVDVEQVLGGVLGRRKVSNVVGASRRPDWLVLGAHTGSNGPVKVFSLESKGASRGDESPNAHHASSLASAVEQLSSMEVDAKVPIGLASLAITGAGPVVVKAVDPGYGSDDVHITSPMIEEMIEEDPAAKPSAPSDEQTGPSTAEVATAITLQSLRNVAQISHNAQAQEALRVQEPTLGPPEHLDTRFGEAMGTSVRFRDRRGRECRVFIGVPRTIVDQLSDGDLAAAREAQTAMARSRQSLLSEDREVTVRQDAPELVEKEFAAPNGALMVFEREE